MKKTLAIILAVVMMVSLLAGCGDKPGPNPDPAGSSLDVAVFYYDFSDVYISSVRNSMNSQLDALGVKYNNYDGAGNQSQQTDQINTAIANGANLLIVNIVETSSRCCQERSRGRQNCRYPDHLLQPRSFQRSCKQL